MRKNLLRFVMRIAVFSLLLCGSFKTGLAHDWPSHLKVSSHITDCLGVTDYPLTSLPTAASVSTQSCAIATPNSSISMAAAYSQLAYRSVSHSNLAGKFTQGIDALAEFWSCLEEAQQAEVFAALPDDGIPPSPAARSKSEELAIRSSAKQEFIEDYMPYDFCVRDWRFGQYSYRGLSRIAHLDLNAAEIADESQLAQAIISESSPASQAAIALGDALHKLNDSKCAAYSELSDLRAVHDIAQVAAYKYLQANASVSEMVERLANHLSVPPSRQYVAPPRFVIYEVHEDNGEQYLLPAGKPAELAGTSNEVLTNGTLALRTKLLGLASQKLENIGMQFLRLSSVIDSLAEPHVASRRQNGVR